MTRRKPKTHSEIAWAVLIDGDHFVKHIAFHLGSIACFSNKEDAEAYAGLLLRRNYPARAVRVLVTEQRQKRRKRK